MKTAIITGVSGSLGAKLAFHLLRQGYQVAGLDIREPNATGLCEAGDHFTFLKCDLRSSEDIVDVLTKLFETGVAPEVVINNAGIIYNSPMLHFEDGVLTHHDFQKWRDVVDVTLSATFYVSACCSQQMVKHAKRGLILNISSICAGGNVGQPAYSAAKAGVNGFTISMAKELAPLGIRVAAIAPGYLDTGSTRAAVEEGLLRQIRKRTPTGKLGAVDELLGAVDFVMNNNYFNGQVLSLDGGLSL